MLHIICAGLNAFLLSSGNVMKKILVFGNPLLKRDSLPVRMLPQLRKAFPELEFVEFDAVEDLEKAGREITLLDSVQGIRSVRVFHDVESFCESPRFTMHDFDLPVYLKLLAKMGMVKKVTIIGVPGNWNEKNALRHVEKAIAGLMADGKAD
jgi:hypothetical protein